MTSQTLSTTAAVLLSLLFSYVPGLSGWYAALDATRKRLIMLALLALVAGGAFALACSEWSAYFGLTLTCDQPGAVVLLQSLALALAANQSTYLITPRRDQGKAL